VTIDDLEGAELKPGMTAETRIFVGELSNVLVVPLQAVSEHKGQFSAFVDDSDRMQRRKVKIGESNEQFVEIVDGLTEGETVALDARSRSAAELKAEGPNDTPEKSPKVPEIASARP
jgi:HlyD family secretion protein